MTPDIDRRTSASLENVHRGNIDIGELTSLRIAVRAWHQLDSNHQAAATLTPERALQIDGVTTATFSGAAIAALAKRLQPDDVQDPDRPDAA